MGSNGAPLLSVIIPARNEEANIRACLASLCSQGGIAYEIFVVDDHSTDRTREIAAEFGSVRVIAAAPLQAGWTGKANAIWTAVPYATGTWILFTDADTVHAPDSLQTSTTEAIANGVDLLSYSPYQEAESWGERVLQPVIFAELNRVFGYDQINDNALAAAAANGQFMLFRRSVYDEIGGHASVKGSFLEDVDLARSVKKKGRLRFRYAPDAVQARMYRNFGQLAEGWTKNLAVLFPNSRALALRRTCEFILIAGGVFAGCALLLGAHFFLGAAVFSAWAIASGLFVGRTQKAGFSRSDAFVSILGLPLFAALLIRSHLAHHRKHRVRWKGRSYSGL